MNRLTEAQIEAVATHMCEQLELDPRELLGCGVLDTMTPKERRDYLRDSGGFVSDVMVYRPRWELYRSKAAEAIALHNAIAEAGRAALAQEGGE